uniref:Uncharacterized protein n=1 Tax=Naja naja TaxID=35670 RepID=A0A8C7E4K4_NAJNA
MGEYTLKINDSHSHHGNLNHSRSFKLSRKWVDILGLQNAKLKRQINEVYREPRFKSLPSHACQDHNTINICHRYLNKLQGPCNWLCRLPEKFD